MIKTAIKIFVVMILMSLSVMAEKKALLVGISDYGDGNGKAGTKYDLKGVEHDITKMRKLLKEWGFKSKILFNQDSLKIGRKLNEYAHTLDEEDEFVFYFTGHGSQTKDVNGDEKDNDGKDETIVLSDGKVNKDFLDDELYSYFNEIKARKLLIFDSCHSATAFKRIGDKPLPKAVSSKAIDGVITSRHVSKDGSQLSSDHEYIVLSAAKDNQKALVGKRGSFFTSALYEQLSESNLNQDFANIQYEVNKKIKKACDKSESKVHDSTVYSSENNLKYMTFKHYFSTQKNIDKSGLSIIGKKFFSEGKEISFKLNMYGKTGHIKIFTIENGKVSMHYGSKKLYRGVVTYPKDFAIEGVRFYKENSKSIEENVVIYIVFSEKPVEINVGSKSNDFPFTVQTNGGKVWKQKFEIGIVK
jgi:hypothetical protein